MGAINADSNMKNYKVISLGPCAVCHVRDQAVCSVLDSEELSELAKISRHVKFEPNQIIVTEGEDKEFVGTITKGVIKLSKTLADGREQIVGLLFPSDFVGRERTGQSNVFGEAVTEVEVCLFNAGQFRQLTQKYPALRNGLYSRALDELDVAREWMVLLGRKTAEEKIATFLLMLARRTASSGACAQTSDGNVSFLLPLRRADIADYLGLTIETVSRQITKFKTGGVIRMLSGREFQVTDMAQLATIAGDEPSFDGDRQSLPSMAAK